MMMTVTHRQQPVQIATVTAAAVLVVLLSACAASGPPTASVVGNAADTSRKPTAALTSLGADPARACAALVAPIPAGQINAPSGPVKTGAVTIDSATLQAATPLVIAPAGPTPAARVTPALPTHCKVLGRIAPSTDSTAPPILFQVNLPAQWNGRYLQFGGGGFNGTLISGLALPPGQRFDAAGPLAQGFVTAGTDSGHQTKPDEPVQQFAANDEAFLNFAHEAYPKVRAIASVIVHRAYGRVPDKNYFVGSSEGGREGLAMAQRYPNAFDGIFSRVPVIHWTGLMHASARNGFVTRGEGWLDQAKVQLVHDAVLAACDADDGVVDTLVSNPVACKAKFDASALRCADGKLGERCLSEAQLKAVQAIGSPYRFPFALANGVTEYPGWGVSGEATVGTGPTGGWPSWTTGLTPPAWPIARGNARSWEYGGGALAHIFARNPNFDIMTYQPTAFATRVQQVSAMMDMTDPNLAPFAQRGGKLIVLEYMADYAQSPYAGIRYVESVQRTLGAATAANFMRLYVAPGVDHVGSGAPGNVDMLAALVDWVEQQRAPSALQVVTQSVAVGFPVERSLPLCEWPAWPKHLGGDASKSASFACTR